MRLVKFGLALNLARMSAKLPIIDPMFAVEITYEISLKLNAPVANVEFFSWSSFELIDGHAYVAAAANINKSPLFCNK